MKNSLFPIRERTRSQLTYKIFSFKPTCRDAIHCFKKVQTQCIASLKSLIIIFALASCGVDLDSDGVKAAAAGNEHTVALKTDGTLWAWGDNTVGQLGNGESGANSSDHSKDKSTPVQVGIDRDWIAVAAGNYHTVAIKSDHTLWAWGGNYYGQLGLEDSGSGTERKTPVQVGMGRDWIAVAAGSFHTVAIKSDKTIWAWGDNHSGQLGLGDDIDRNIPAKVNLESVIALYAGSYHTVVIKNDHTLWAWGGNTRGTLGDGTLSNSNTPVQEARKDTDWATVFAGNQCTIAVKTDGTLWAWGWNQGAKLGLGDGASMEYNTPVQVVKDRDWASVSGGDMHTIAHKRNGTLWAWGWNEGGQLGLGDSGIDTARNTPEQLGEAADLVGVSGGQNHSTALRRSGILWTWGRNNRGQLGDGTTTDRYRPVAVKWE